MKQSIFIAIPSHNRQQLIQTTTLPLLKNHNVNMNNVYVFCSTKSYNNYVHISNIWGFNLIKSFDSITETRNHIISFFQSGDRVVEIDDDVKDILIVEKNRKAIEISNFIEFLNESFDLLPGQGLWGVNSTCNGYFSSGKDNYGMYSIVNSFLGYYNDKRILLTLPEKEDFERVIKFYELHLPVMKRGRYGVKTKYWTNKGGIQSHYDFETRMLVQKKCADILLKKYPWAIRKYTRKNGIVDVRFKKNLPTSKKLVHKHDDSTI